MGDNYCGQGLIVGQGPVGRPSIDKDSSWARATHWLEAMIRGSAVPKPRPRLQG